MKVAEEDVAVSLDGRLLELIVLPTEKCNFRCTYCYEDFEIGRMKTGTVQALKALLGKRAPELANLSLSWFGGEPLLAEQVIRELANHAYRLSEKHGFCLSGGFTTNGYLLTPDLVREFHALRHRSYQITLDGPAVQHNSTRRLANGRQTFDRIWSNLLMMRDIDLDLGVTLRLHVSPSNMCCFPNLLPRSMTS